MSTRTRTTDDRTPVNGAALPRPIWVTVGRVSIAKNIQRFLDLDLPGTKVVIGDGPDREQLEAQHPGCRFLGYQFGQDLAAHIANADVFVYPQRTDDFGLEVLASIAGGLPIAALPAGEPAGESRTNVPAILDEDLEAACRGALDLGSGTVPDVIDRSTVWRSTGQFLTALARRAFDPRKRSVRGAHS